MLVLGACAPMYVDPGPPIEEPFIAADEWAVMPDGVSLPLEIWRPEGEAVAAVVALHGFGDYRNAFRELGPILADDGVAVYAFDQRGFGGAPRHGRWHGAATMAGDAATVARLAHAEHPGRPVYLLGESMGGAVAMLAMASEHPPADGVILSAPAVWGRRWMPRYQVWGLEAAGHTLPWLPLNPTGLPFKPSDNIEMLRRLGRDPLFIKNPRVDTVYGLADLMDAAQEVAPLVRGPVLMLYGGKDELVPKKPTCAAIGKLVERPAEIGSLRIALYPEGYHMLFRDLAGGRVIADIAAWARDPGAPLPSGHESLPEGEWLEAFCRAKR